MRKNKLSPNKKIAAVYKMSVSYIVDQLHAQMQDIIASYDEGDDIEYPTSWQLQTMLDEKTCQKYASEWLAIKIQLSEDEWPNEEIKLAGKTLYRIRAITKKMWNQVRETYE